MNVILLPKSAFCFHTQTAIIDDNTQVGHIKTVLSAQIGDTIKIGMLDGNLGTAVVTELDERCLLTNVLLDKSPPPKLDLTVILALPRPKVLRRLIMDMTAMGVPNIILVNSYRTDKSYWQSPLLLRLDEFVLEGLQQSIDTIAPKILLAKRFKPFVEDELPTLLHHKNAVVAHPYAKQNFTQLTKEALPQVLIVGAEGGFIPYEIELLSSVGVQAATLGERILRTESAINALLGRWLQ